MCVTDLPSSYFSFSDSTSFSKGISVPGCRTEAERFYIYQSNTVLLVLVNVLLRTH